MKSHSSLTVKTARGELSYLDKTVSLDDIKYAFYQGESSRRGAFRCVKSRPDLLDALKQYSSKYGLSYVSHQNLAVNYIIGLTEQPVCKICGKPTRFNNGLWRYSIHCSAKCRCSDPDVRKKHDETNLKKYGSANAAKNEQVKNKMANTVRSRYGSSCYLSSSVGIRKLKGVLLERYGVDATWKLPWIREKRESTMLSRYGVKSPFHNADIMRRRDATCMKRFGCLYPGAEKLAELAGTTRYKVFDGLSDMFPDYEIQCSRDEFLGVYEHENTWKCKSCGSLFSRTGAPFCRCHAMWKTQNEIFKVVKNLCPDAEVGNRSVLSGLELDVYVPSRKLAFEYDGLYWHSEENGKDKKYHLNKTVLAETNGIRLIHIFEDEWLLRRRTTEIKIKSLLGGIKRAIYARKCTVSKIDIGTARRFLDKYHIQGSSCTSVNLGLYYGRHLVSVCTFNPKEKSSGSWYLERYATVASFRVIGGCGKILSFFIRNWNPSCIRTFADRRWSVGNMYERLGFKKTSVTKPAYWYIPHKGKYRIHRFNLRKDNEKMFPVFYDKSCTEVELAKRNGYLRIWDCGQIVYDLILQDKRN